MASLALLNYTGGKCVWLLIIWQAVYVCVLQRSPWGGRARSEQLDAVWRGTKQPCAEL